MPRNKYGLQWDDSVSDLKLEMYMIQRGGKWTDKGVTYGLGDSHHYEQMRKILWPHLDSHRWHNLCRDEILRENASVTVLMGPGSSGKTHEAAWIYLCEYFCFPQETCVLVSSTDTRGLRLRVWGEMAMLWEAAVQKFPELPGHMLDSKMAITTDTLDEDDFDDRTVRDFRRGVIAIPTISGGRFVGLSKWIGIKQKRVRLIADEACFPKDSMVDTPLGKRPIQDIQPGDEVLNALGACRVRHTMKSRSEKIVRITTKSGRSVVSTPSHPIFTQQGWVCACEVNQSHYMVGTYEAMSLLQETIPPCGSPENLQQVPAHAKEVRALRRGFPAKEALCADKVLFDQVQVRLDEQIPKVSKDLSRMWGGFPWHDASNVVPEMPGVFDSLQGVRKDSPIAEVVKATLLQSILRFEVGSESTQVSGKAIYERAHRQDTGGSPEDIPGESGEVCRNAAVAQRRDDAIHAFSYRRTKTGAADKSKSDFKIHGSQAAYQRGEWDWSHNRRDNYSESFSWFDKQSCNQDRNEEWVWVSPMLQSGYRISGHKAWGGSGREFPQMDFEGRTGQEKDSILVGDWVDRVEVLEQENCGGTGSGGCGIEVYNLEIEGHPSYSVNGFLVHNSMMGASFLSAFSNLNKNISFKAIVLGNPNDPLDPLGKAAEPKHSWTEEYLDTTKTRVWDTRFMNGRCVNLIGLDSPNMDFPQDQPPKYPYLISKKKIEETLSFFDKDSLEYYSQCVGSMKIGTLNRRVITREMCRKFRANEPVIWVGNSSITKVYFVDAAYGGDRCVAGMAEFGKDVSGKIILAFSEPKIIPIKVGGGEPEEQIARFVKADCEALDVPPENMGHDATGRGSLGTALSSIWANGTNPVESGGVPTDRPVSSDHFIVDPKTQQRRLKLCSEHYDRRVSEYWFSVRYAVEASQIRQLPEEAMDELCMRNWDLVKNKYWIEPKTGTDTRPGMKQRTGKSPDMGDWAAGIVEMARRKGFTIAKLTNEDAQERDVQWFNRLLSMKKNLSKNHALNYKV